MYFKNQVITTMDYEGRLGYLGFARGLVGIFDERLRNQIMAKSFKGHVQYVSSIFKS